MAKAKNTSGKTEAELKGFVPSVDEDETPLAELDVENEVVPVVDEVVAEDVPMVQVPKVKDNESQVVIFVKDVEHIWVVDGYISGKKNDRRRVSNTVAYYLRSAGLVI